MSDDDALFEADHMILRYEEAFRRLATAAAPTELTGPAVADDMEFASAFLAQQMHKADREGDTDTALAMAAAVQLIHQAAVEVRERVSGLKVDSDGQISFWRDDDEDL